MIVNIVLEWQVMNLKKIMIGLLVILSVTFLSACGEDESGKYTPDPQLETEVENFEYTNQDGETVSLEDLKDNYWVGILYLHQL